MTDGEAIAVPATSASGWTEAPKDPLWFNPHLGPSGTRAHEVISAVVPLAERYGRQRALRVTDRHTLYKVLIPLVSNLMYHYLSGSRGHGIPVPRSKNWRGLGNKGNRYNPFVFPRSFPKMLDTLSALGFIIQIIGDPDKHRLTTVKAGPKLIELIKERGVTLEDIEAGSGEEIIVLKRFKRGYWDGGARIEYRDTPTTTRFRDELRAVNTWLEKANIRFDAAAAGYDQPVNVHARRLYRHFTGRFDLGGRLFNGFWQTLPKDVRVNGIRIDGEPVVGLDYSQVNPLLAYYVAKADPPPGDAYTLPGLEDYREGVKKIFNAMLFNHPVKKFPKGSRELFPRRLKCEDVTEAILKRHPKLKGVLLSHESGHQLQFLESAIMMRVLRKCLKRNIVALPVFDSVVVKSSLEIPVREIMRQEFKIVTGLNVTIKREGRGPHDDIDPSGGL